MATRQSLERVSDKTALTDSLVRAMQLGEGLLDDHWPDLFAARRFGVDGLRLGAVRVVRRVAGEAIVNVYHMPLSIVPERHSVYAVLFHAVVDQVTARVSVPGGQGKRREEVAIASRALLHVLCRLILIEVRILVIVKPGGVPRRGANAERTARHAELVRPLPPDAHVSEHLATLTVAQPISRCDAGDKERRVVVRKLGVGPIRAARRRFLGDVNVAVGVGARLRQPFA
mmetsp:Transcript_9138/g.21514  ORF Transcript_9138/g.21514 Transcript_9138/m.21514 type:complete len:229 (-) Transcript_9138:39-725(-)